MTFNHFDGDETTTPVAQPVDAPVTEETTAPEATASETPVTEETTQA